jgi:peptide-methionine (R)-S-oxide reductase
MDRRALLGTAALGGIAWLVFRPTPGEATARFEVTHSPAEWKRLLGAERYRILRDAGTERAFTSPLNEEHRRGTFKCAGCGVPLFSSTTKFESGTGWPSFYRPLPRAIITHADHAC